MADLFSLKGKVALVTGASKEMGQEVAHTLAEYGADVAVTARNAAQLEEAAARIRTTGRKAIAIPADLTNIPEAAVDCQPHGRGARPSGHPGQRGRRRRLFQLRLGPEHDRRDVGQHVRPQCQGSDVPVPGGRQGDEGQRRRFDREYLLGRGQRRGAAHEQLRSRQGRPGQPFRHAGRRVGAVPYPRQRHNFRAGRYRQRQNFDFSNSGARGLSSRSRCRWGESANPSISPPRCFTWSGGGEWVTGTKSSSTEASAACARSAKPRLADVHLRSAANGPLFIRLIGIGCCFCTNCTK